MTFEQADDGMHLRFDAMASRNELVAAGVPHASARAALEAARAEVWRIEAKYSRYRPDSVVSRINAAAGTAEPVEVDAETAALIEFGASLFELSDGRFDITSGPLRRAWNFREAREPSQDELERLLPLIGWHQVEWDGQRVRLPHAGMELDFGGIGKEYAADRAHAVLVQSGVAHGFANLAGDLHVVGPRADGTPWAIGIQHPREPDATCAQVHLARGALATSGDYERFFVTTEGRRCCHILDPRTGRSVAHWQSVSVISATCAAAGALATIGMLLGADAPAFLRKQGVAFLAVDPCGHLLAHDVELPLPGSPAVPPSVPDFRGHLP
jgi:thiamine biosynthesis lipoprotein